jgi:hypothetical protein
MLRIRGGHFFHAIAFKKWRNKDMEDKKPTTRNKGGRPRKAVRKDQLIALKCTPFERRAIEARAKSASLTVSEYLRELGMTGKIEQRGKVFPKEVLALSGTINHIAANVNQIAKKRNSNEELSPWERAELKVQSGELKGIAQQIKTYLE